MVAANQVSIKTRRIRLKPIALPVEHGGWSLLFEPIVLGLLLAPSVAGVFISAAATGAFLARHPLKLAVGDWRRHRRFMRTAWAERIAFFYLALATLAFTLAIMTRGADFLLPLLFAAPFAIGQLAYDALGRSRALSAEMAGSISTGALATAIAIAGGWPRPLAFGLWAILTARTVPTILYVRARLRRLRGKPASPRSVIVAHLLAIAMVAGIAYAGAAPLLTVAAVVILLLRAVFGFSRFDKRVTAKKLGLRELGFGVITVLAVVLGDAIGW